MTKGNLFKGSKTVSLTMARKSKKELEREKLIAELDHIHKTQKSYPLQELIDHLNSKKK
jgi:hypothetical protein